VFQLSQSASNSPLTFPKWSSAILRKKRADRHYVIMRKKIADRHKRAYVRHYVTTITAFISPACRWFRSTCALHKTWCPLLGSFTVSSTCRFSYEANPAQGGCWNCRVVSVRKQVPLLPRAACLVESVAGSCLGLLRFIFVQSFVVSSRLFFYFSSTFSFLALVFSLRSASSCKARGTALRLFCVSGKHCNRPGLGCCPFPLLLLG